MKKLLSVLLLAGVILSTNAYDKKSLVERFTNASCVPCAELNAAWYTTTTHNYVNSDMISHIVYNVWWPGPGDPMYLLNQTDNTTRTNYYGCNYVPWIDINGTHISETQGSFISAVTNGNSQFAPFNIVISQGAISDNLIEVFVKIIRDPGDITTFNNIKLKVALTEKTVSFNSPPGGNGERIFYSICRKMLPDATGSTFTIPAPGDSTTISLQYIPSAAFLQSVNFDSLRVVAFIQDDNSRMIYQSSMKEVNKNYMATITTQEEYYFSESTETAPYTAYIKNIGMFPDTYNIGLDFNGPNGWQQSFTTVNGTFNFGETDTVTVNPGDSTEVLVNVNANSINGYGKTYVQFISTHGSSGNIELRFTTFGLNILLVDDDGGANYENYFIQELDSMNAEFGIIPSQLLVDNPSGISTFNIVVWNTAVTEPGLNFDEMNSLKTFLDNGGSLYLNGVDLAYQMADPSSPYYSVESMDFFSNYLHSSYVLREHTSTIAVGVTGDPITDGLGTMTLVGGSGANTINHSEGHYVNQINAEGNYSENMLALWLKPNDHPGIRAFHGLSGKVVFTTFGFETIALSERRTVFAEKIIDWLNIPVSVEEGPDFQLTKFELYQNYPNPFNPATTFSYQVPNSSYVSIKVYDIIGREVSVLVNEVKQPGSYQVSFDGKNLASGVYIYRMTAGNFSSVKKMSLLK